MPDSESNDKKYNLNNKIKMLGSWIFFILILLMCLSFTYFNIKALTYYSGLNIFIITTLYILFVFTLTIKRNKRTIEYSFLPQTVRKLFLFFSGCTTLQWMVLIENFESIIIVAYSTFFIWSIYEKLKKLKI